MKPNLNTQADAVIRLFTDKEGYFTPENLMTICGPMIKATQDDRQFLFKWNSPKWYISELYGYLKHIKELPELSRKRKLELWEEVGKDKLLYLSLYLIEII